jgi:aerobic carbon-monoxide dehydrogenase large subunit
MLRSPHAHARVTGIDAGSALTSPDVLAVFTGEDLARDGIGGVPCVSAVSNRDGSQSVLPLYPRDGTLQEGYSLAAGGGSAPGTVIPV